MKAPTIRYYQTGSIAVGNRLLDPEQRSVQADEQRTNAITCGHRACQGCGEALGARYALDAAMRATGGQMIAANATGCLEVFSTPYPETSWRIPWIHSLFANAPAVSTGIAAALRAKGREDIRVVGQGGDGGTVDIGMACLSGMFERGDDVLYICYDNEAYMNTGVQRSGATPPAARTTTTPAVGPEPGNVFGQGKSAPLIAMAHEIPYVATATVAELRDLEAKVQTAMQIRGARYLHVFVPCPLGWGSASKDTIRIARLAKESGIFPVFEARDGEVTDVSKIRRQVPIEDYLRPQRRFAHLFKPELRTDVIARIQAGANRNIRRFGLLEAEGRERERERRRADGQAVCDHTGRRLEPGEQDRLMARGTPGVCAPPAALQPRVPGRGEHPAVAVSRRVRRLRGSLARARQGQPAASRDGARVLPPVRDLVQPRPPAGVEGADKTVGIHGVERFLGDEAIRQGWQLTADTEPTGRRVLVVGAGPSGLSAAYHLTRRGHAVTICDAGPMAGGMMRFGIPKYRLPRNVLDAEVQRILDLGVTLQCDAKVTNILHAMRDGSFDAAFLAVGAHIGKRAYIPAGEAAHILDAVTLLRGMEGQERPLLGRRVVVYGGGDTAMDAARTAKRLGAEEAIVVYRRTRERMPAHDSEVQEALEEGVMMKWLSTIRHAGEGRVLLEKMELDETGFPQPTGELAELQADSLVLALGQEADLSLLGGVPGLEIEDGVVRVDQRMMTGHEGIFAGGDMVPAERTVTVGVGHGKQAARNIDAWLRGTEYAHPPAPELASFEELNTWYYSDAPATVAPRLDAIRRQSTFAEVTLGLDETNALFEARRCLSCGNCFGCDNCYGVCPDNAVLKVDEDDGYAFDLDYCKGCGICVEECPCGAIEMIPETI